MAGVAGAAFVTAIAAASGGGVENPTVLSLLEDTEAQGDYNTRAQLYSGSQRAEGLNLKAKSARMSGKAAQKGGYFSAAGNIISGFGSAFRKYG